MITTVLPTTPHQIAAETWVIPTLVAEPSGAYVGVNSLVIRGAEPVIVDTGAALVRDHWLAQTFAVVEPQDVRWIFLSHDDHDHVGNIDVVLDMCPNATLIASFPIVNRLAVDVELPLERMRWLNEGESLALPDRVLTAVRPPMFDAPSTRALHDSTTRMLWAADSFASLLPGEVYEADDVPADLFAESFVTLNLGNTPWLSWVDAQRYAAHVESSAALPKDVVASAHGPVLRGDRIDDAYRRTFDLVGAAPLVSPGQDFLEQFLAGALALAN